MSDHAAVAEKVSWEGASLFGGGWNKLMMWLFIVTDALIFAGFLATYGFVRLSSDNWPDRSHIFHLDFIALMTFTLITSSATMGCAVAASKHGERKMVLRFLLLTILGGAAFLGMQAYEWAGLIRAGASLTANPWGAPLFGACFFVLTGFHGTHVLSGLIVLAVTSIRAMKGINKPRGWAT